MDINSVIILGHKAKQPLIGSRSELADGYEPHDTICPAPRTSVVHHARTGGAGCTRGGADGWVPERGYTGYPAEGQIEALFMEYEV